MDARIKGIIGSLRAEAELWRAFRNVTGVGEMAICGAADEAAELIAQQETKINHLCNEAKYLKAALKRSEEERVAAATYIPNDCTTCRHEKYCNLFITCCNENMKHWEWSGRGRQ